MRFGLCLTAVLLIAACGDAIIVPKQLNEDQSRKAINPTNYFDFSPDDDDAPAGLDIAYSISGALKFAASCTTSYVNNTRHIRCAYDNLTCTEVYASSGELLSWDCGNAGNYFCQDTAYEYNCVFTDPVNNTQCEERFSHSWVQLSSACPRSKTSGINCKSDDQGGLLCSTSASSSPACSFHFDPSYTIVGGVCSGSFSNSRIECFTDDTSNLVCVTGATSLTDGTGCRTTYKANTLKVIASDCSL